MGGGQSQNSYPAPQNQYATGAALGYVLGPQYIAGSQSATQGSQLFPTAGAPVGILPAYSTLQDIANQDSYFGSLAGANPNPILNKAVSTLQTPPKISVSMPSTGGIGGGGAGGGGFGGTIIPSSATAGAVNTLAHPPSVFDVMSGGPIVNTINQKAQQASDAYTTQALANMTKAEDISYANDVANGFISGSTIDLGRQRITETVLADINNMNATMSLNNTKYLGDLAMQDVINGTNSAKDLIDAAMQEKGINATYAAQIAGIQAQQATALAVAQINSQTQLALGQQTNALDLLKLGQTDYASQQAAKLGVAQLPLNILSGLTSTSPIANSSTGKTL